MRLGDFSEFYVLCPVYKVNWAMGLKGIYIYYCFKRPVPSCPVYFIKMVIFFQKLGKLNKNWA